MNVNEMTAQQAADWCFSHDGWEYRPTEEHPCRWCHLDGREVLDKHPYPLTLDGAAAALPDRWAWQMQSPSRFAMKAKDGHPRMVGVYADHADETTVGTFGPDELTARWRLNVACRLMEGRPKE